MTAAQPPRDRQVSGAASSIFALRLVAASTQRAASRRSSSSSISDFPATQRKVFAAHERKEIGLLSRCSLQTAAFVSRLCQYSLPCDFDQCGPVQSAAFDP